MNEAGIRNLSAAKAIAAQQKSLHSLAKIVLHDRITLDYLLAEQGGICTVANIAYCTFPGKLRPSYVSSLNKPLGLRNGSFFDLFKPLLWNMYSELVGVA